MTIEKQMKKLIEACENSLANVNMLLENAWEMNEEGLIMWKKELKKALKSVSY